MSTVIKTSSDSQEVEPTAPAEKRKPVPHLIALIEQLIITFGVYVLSIGPMYWPWYNAKYVEGPLIIAAFYEPLWLLAGWVPAIGDALNWYCSFWV